MPARITWLSSTSRPRAAVRPPPWSEGPRSLVRFGDDLDVAELDRVRHQQAKRGHEQRCNRGLVDVRRGNVHPEPVSGQVAAVAEPDGSVKGRTVFGHRNLFGGEG